MVCFSPRADRHLAVMIAINTPPNVSMHRNIFDTSPTHVDLVYTTHPYVEKVKQNRHIKRKHLKFAIPSTCSPGRSYMFDPKVPYNDLPRLPPKADIETKSILKACIKAQASLVGLRGMADRIPNQGMLINIIPMLEAQTSSEIANIVTTTDRLFQYANEAQHA